MSTLFGRTEDSLKKQFEAKKLEWPPREVYIRSFKYDRQLEVWVKGDSSRHFKLFKTYRVCVQSGQLGPKRMEGDFQVPEGFYYINQFNPNSNYHLALGLNYPNASDKIITDSMHLRPGGNIFIHGDCVSTGCIPITDTCIDEVYVIALNAREEGQDFIPVHVFPVRFNVKKSNDFFEKSVKDNPALLKFGNTLKEAYEYFETKKELPLIMVDKNGNYVVE
jgi:murein L,D-transpeptidase YafK